jgi:hypothetical protein
LVGQECEAAYEVISEEGQAHEKLFHVSLKFKQQGSITATQQEAMTEREFIGIGRFLRFTLFC